MLSTVYAQRVLGNDPSIKFAADVLNGLVNIWDETCTAINGWCSDETVYKTWDAMGRPDTEDFMSPDYDTFTDPERRRNAIADARITAIAMIIEDQLYDLILDMISSGKLKVVPASLVEGPEDPHGVGWVEGGIPGIIECDCYIMEGDEK